MKIITIGDIHGRNEWKRIIDKDYDKMVFVGDYFDSYTIPGIIQLHNFNEIIEFKKNNLDKVELLIGNHDYHYFPGVTETYSGYKSALRFDMGNVLREAYINGYLKVCYEYGDYIFSHAGLTKTWCLNSNIDMNDLTNSVNELFEFKPDYFRFTSGRNFSNYGNDVTQGPFWVRPASLFRDMVDGYKFVIGHTSETNIKIINEKIFNIDCLDNTNEYLEITDEGYKVISFI